MPRPKKNAGNGEVFNASAEVDDDGGETAAMGGGFTVEPAPVAQGIEEAPPPAFAPPPRPAVTMSVRARQEQRVEDEKDRNADELSAAIAQWAIPGKKYSFDLMRLRPASYKDEATGRTFNPGRDDGKGMFLQHYDEAPTLAEIEDVHGGTDYVLVAKGPDKDNPDKLATKRFKVAILGPPKTLGMPTGAIPFAHVPAPPAPADNTVANVTQNMMMMMQAMMENSRKDLQSMLATIQQSQQQKPAAPTIDPATMLRLEEERAEKQRQHELSMKRMELETLSRQKSDEAAREEARQAREEARAERQRQHEKELAAMKAAEDARREEARERRAESDRLTQMFQAAQKEQAQSMEKMITRLESSKQKEDPEERILRTIDLVDRLRGSNDKPEPKVDEGGPLTKAIANALPEVLKSADKFLNRAPPAPSKPQKPTIIAVDEPTALPAPAPAAPATTPAVEVVQPAKETIPPFEWPAPDADMTQMATLMGKNIELALQAQWGHKRVFEEVMLKFPASFLAMLRALPLDALLASIEQNAPPDAALRTNSGKLTMRLMYKALQKRGDG